MEEKMKYEIIHKETVILDPRNNMEPRKIPVQIRIDPLTGRTTRIAHFMKLEWKKPDMEKIVGGTESWCPFCPGKVLDITPKFPEDILPEGRLTLGDKTLFPNIAPYDTIGAVATMGGDHFIPMADFKPERIAGTFRLGLDFFEKIEKIGHPESVYHIINWNYMPPAGSSLIHPHHQVFATSTAPVLMREELEAATSYMKENGRNYWDDLVEAEIEDGGRYLGKTGRFHWFVSFTPLGVAGDVVAVAENVRSTMALTDNDLYDISDGLVRMMKAYDKIGIYSFNMNFFTGARNDDFARFHLLFTPRTFYNQALGTPDIGALQKLFNESVCMAFPEDIATMLRPDFNAA